MAQLRELGAAVIADYPHFGLEEALDHLDEAGGPDLSEVTRGNILRALNEVSLSGRVDPMPFLAGIWPIHDMPSRSSNGRTRAADIDQAMVRNDDWSTEDLLRELDAVTCSRRRFFRLLEAVVHPRTRDEAEVARLVGVLNPHLRRDGFALVTVKRVSGYPVYAVQETTPAGHHPADGLISAGLAAFDEASVHAAWNKALERRGADLEGAITAARTLLETVCKHIVEGAGGTHAEADDLPKLYRAAAKALQLAPDQHTEEVFKAILGSCQSIVTSLCTLRNRLSNAHGRGRKPAKP